MKKTLLLLASLIFSTCSCARPVLNEVYHIGFFQYVYDQKGNDYVIFGAYKEDNYIVLNGNFKFNDFPYFEQIYYFNDPNVLIDVSKTKLENNLSSYDTSNFTYQGKLLLYFPNSGFDYKSNAWLFDLHIYYKSDKPRYFEIDGERLEDLKNENI